MRIGGGLYVRVLGGFVTRIGGGIDENTHAANLARFFSGQVGRCAGRPTDNRPVATAPN